MVVQLGAPVVYLVQALFLLLPEHPRSQQGQPKGLQVQAEIAHFAEVRVQLRYALLVFFDLCLYGDEIVGLHHLQMPDQLLQLAVQLPNSTNNIIPLLLNFGISIGIFLGEFLKAPGQHLAKSNGSYLLA